MKTDRILNHSASLFDVPGTEDFALEQDKTQKLKQDKTQKLKQLNETKPTQL